MIADQYDVFLVDLDGVVYCGDEVLPGSREGLARLRERGKAVYFLTNDPRPTRQELSDRLNALRIAAVPAEIITAGWATADYLAANGVTRAFVIGTAGLVSELEARGVGTTAAGDCQAVVAGYDESTTFGQIQAAVRQLEKGARFVATNADTSFPGRDGRCVATGALVEAVRVASGRQPVIIGKPYPYIFRAVMSKVAPGLRAVMIGDNPETDILGAHRQGIDALLVAKGRCRFPAKSDYRLPDGIIADLSALFTAGAAVPPWRPPGFPWPDSVRPGVAAVVLDGQGRVLLVKRSDNGLWGLPSGHVEIGETVTAAVGRELQEETGLVVEVEKLIGVYSDPVSQVFPYPSGITTHFITLCFLGRVTGGCLQADAKEITDAAFFATGRLPAGLLKMHPQWLSDALAGQAGAFVR